METIKFYYKALRAVYPIVSRALRSGQLWRPQCELTQPDPDILCEYEVFIPMPEGFELKAQVFRSRKAETEGIPVDVIMCV